MPIHCRNCSCEPETDFEHLKALRWEIMQETGKKAFHIFWDSQLTILSKLEALDFESAWVALKKEAKTAPINERWLERALETLKTVQAQRSAAERCIKCSYYVSNGRYQLQITCTEHTGPAGAPGG